MWLIEKDKCHFCGALTENSAPYVESGKNLCSSGCQFGSYAVNTQLIGIGDFVVYNHKSAVSLINKEHKDCTMLIHGFLGNLRSAFYVHCISCAIQKGEWHKFTVSEYEVLVLSTPLNSLHGDGGEMYSIIGEENEDFSSYEMNGFDNNHTVAAAINAQIDYDIDKRAMYEPLIKGSTYIVRRPVTSNNLLTYLTGSKSE